MNAGRCNPFRARNLSPGRIPYSFRPGQDIQQLVDRFRDDGYRGQIVGSHGTGKTTLLFAMGAELTRAGHQVARILLEPSDHGPSGRSPSGRSPSSRSPSIRQRLRDVRPPDIADPARPAVLLIDGIGLVNWWTRRRFLRFARRAGWGILITAHRDLGLPSLCDTNVTVDDARRIIPLIVGLDEQDPANGEQTTDKHDLVPRELVAQLLDQHDGDLREVLFSLYDWHGDQH